MPTPHDHHHTHHGEPGHTRAECAMTAIETGMTLLQMTAVYAAEAETFEDFRAWSLGYITRHAQNPEEAAAASALMRELSRADLHQAGVSVELFLAGFTRRLRGVPDDVLDAALGKMPPGFSHS